MSEVQTKPLVKTNSNKKLPAEIVFDKAY